MVVHSLQPKEGIVVDCFDYDFGRIGFGRVGIDCVGSTVAKYVPARSQYYGMTLVCVGS